MPQDIREKYVSVLANYVPEGLAPELVEWILAHKVMVKITRGRKSKFGDYRHPYGNDGHRITINHDLNKYAFLVTLLHEMAHLLTWEKHQNRVHPHGQEWKNFFKQIMKPYLGKNIFPIEIKTALQRYLENPGASSCSDKDLYKALRQHDHHKIIDGWVHLEDLGENTVFELEDGRQFERIEKLRKFYLCRQVGTQKRFRISPVMMVRKV